MDQDAIDSKAIPANKDIEVPSQEETVSKSKQDDDTDSKSWGLPAFLIKTDELPQKVEKFSLEYKMDHASRGVAYIFNNKKFRSRLNLNERRGTDVDCKKLEKTLLHIGFTKKNIKVCNDYTVAEMKREIMDVAHANHTHCDCLFVAVLSHGDLGFLYGTDGKFSANDLWEPFMADRCPTLAGKPKMFFIQACQGDRVDDGHLMLQDVTDGPVQYKIPSHADFLIAYSTVPGFYSWRNTTEGSWFIQALCSVLLQYGQTEDIVTMLTFVNQKVAMGFESSVPNIPTMNAKKQIPCHMSMLIRKVYFRPKTEEDMDVSK